MWLILFSAKNRVLTDEERNELHRLCEVLKQGIPGRDIYNGAVLQFCSQIQSSGLFENGRCPETEEFLERLDGIKLMVG